MHIPKTGSSIGTALLHLANRQCSSCNATLPADAVLPNCAALAAAHAEERCTGTPEETFLHRYPYATYFAGTIWSKSIGDFGGHDALIYKRRPSAHQLVEGVRLFGLFREPQTRALSSYHHFRGYGSKKQRAISAAEYLVRIRGTATKMLAGQMKGALDCAALYYDCRSANVVPDVPRALSRLSRFAFVGLTEQFNLSVCLLHLMFGGACRQSEFVNIRPGRWHAAAPSMPPLPPLPRDDADEAVYEAAHERFMRDAQTFGATPATCARRCPGVVFGG